MNTLPTGSTRRLAGILAVLAGAIAGSTAVVLAGSAIAQRAVAAESPLLEVTHLPPLLTVPGEQVELRYDAYCAASGSEEDGRSCDVTGSVFLRTGESGSFREISLTRARMPGGGALVAQLPEAVSSSRDGFTYYAVFQASPGGETLILPAGGASAPQRSLPLDRAVEVDLGSHVFGTGRRADERVAEAAWGQGPGDVGLEQGRNLPPIGGSALDVDASGTVLVLDHAHRRVLRWRRGARAPVQVPVAITGTLADMSLAPDGTIYILESAGRLGRAPLVRRFDSDGRELEATEIAERTPSQIRMGPDGPVILQQPSGQWMPLTSGGSWLDPQTQREEGRAGRPLRGGGEVIVLRRDNEIRLALVGADGVRRSWRVTSATALAEVQLAEPLGRRLVVVVRVYTDTADEFVALVLDHKGVAQSITLKSADWAETAPLSRFRLAGSSLYQLGSTPAGLFVDRFDLEVR